MGKGREVNANAFCMIPAAFSRKLKKERRIFLLDTQLSTYISIIIILVARHISQKGRWTLGGIQTRQIA